MKHLRLYEDWKDVWSETDRYILAIRSDTGIGYPKAKVGRKYKLWQDNIPPLKNVYAKHPPYCIEIGNRIIMVHPTSNGYWGWNNLDIFTEDDSLKDYQKRMIQRRFDL